MEHHLGAAPGHQLDELVGADVELVERERVRRRRPGPRPGWPSDPVDRSSTTSTAWPSARSRSTRFDPMNPAPPVTITCTSPPSTRRSRRHLRRHPGVDEPCPRGHLDVVAHHRHRRRARSPGRRRRPGPGSSPPPGRPAPTRAPGRSTESLDRARRARPRCRRRRRWRVTVAPPATDAPRAEQAEGRTSPRTTGAPSVHTPSATCRAPGRGGPGPGAVEQVGVGLQVGGRACRCRASRRRSPWRTRAPSAASAGNVSRSTDTRRPAGMRAEHRGLEDVGPGVDQVGGRLVGRGLLDELDDPAVGVGGDHAEPRRVVDRP